MSDNSTTYGEHGRPLWNERDRQAEALRSVLRAAGLQEWGETRPGFVVEGNPPFHVACAGLSTGDDQAVEERRYVSALVSAGYQVTADPSGVGLQAAPS